MLSHPFPRLNVSRTTALPRRMKKGSANNRSVLPAKHDAAMKKTTANMKKSLGAMGLDTTDAVHRARERSQSRGRKRERSVAAAEGGEDVEMGEAGAPKKRLHSSKSRRVGADGLAQHS